MWWVGPQQLAVLTLLGGPLAQGYDAVHKLEAARLYGNVGVYAYYFVDILVGRPSPQRASVIVDTGSAICAFPCAGCAHCGKHLDAAFDVSRSTTATWMACGTKAYCSQCIAGRCSYSQSYTEGSAIKGSWFYDYVSLGDEFQQNPAVMARLGCHSRETRLFYTQKANGIFGMAPGRTGRPTILEDLFRDRKHINTSLFAMCLADEGGLLTVGGYNTSLHSQEILWVPMAVRSYYAVELAQVGLEGGDVVLRGGFGHTIVDSGTTYTYLPSALYRKLAADVSSFCRKHRDCGGRPEGTTCWRVQSREASALSGFPALRITFTSGGSILWRPRSYLYRKQEMGNTWCYGFQDNGAAHETVLGATWMLHKDVVFDIGGGRLGLAEARCPDFVKRPPAPAGRGVRVQQKTPGVADGRPGLFTAVLVLLVGSGLFVVVSNLRLAGQRAARQLRGEPEGGAARPPPRPLQPQAKRRQASTPTSASPTFIGKSISSVGEEGAGLNAGESKGVCTTPIEIWMRPVPSSGSEGGTPGSACGENLGSSSDAHAEDSVQLI